MLYLTSFRQAYSTANSLLYLLGMPLKTVDRKWEKWERNRNFNVKSNTVHIVTVITVKKSLQKKRCLVGFFALLCCFEQITSEKFTRWFVKGLYKKNILLLFTAHIVEAPKNSLLECQCQQAVPNNNIMTFCTLLKREMVEMAHFPVFLSDQCWTIKSLIF